MLDNFKEIYDSEIERQCEEDTSQILEHILKTLTIRSFVYEVCKKCLEAKPKQGKVEDRQNIDHIPELPKWLGSAKDCHNKNCYQYDETCERNCKLKHPEQREACFGFVGKEENETWIR